MELHYQIVRVLDAERLIDCESYERRYRPPEGKVLVPGHYVVIWDETADPSAFDEHATYVGPYKSSMLATLMLHGYLNLHATRRETTATRRDKAAETV